MYVPFPETAYGVAKRLEVVAGWLQAAAGESGSLRILDVGCGTGDQLTAPLAQLGHRVLGIDVHPPTIELARARHPVAGLCFEVGEVASLARRAQRFDAVICSEVLEHVHDPDVFLRLACSLVAPGGVLVITTPNGYGAYEWLVSLQQVLRRTGVHQVCRSLFWSARRGMAAISGRPAPSRPLEHLTSAEDAGFVNTDSGHVQFFTVPRLEQLFREAGLCVVERRARTVLCGPYADAVLGLLPGRRRLYAWNAAAADWLPFAMAADWMYLLRPAP